MKCTWCEEEFGHPPVFGPGERTAFCDEDCLDLWKRRRANAPKLPPAEARAEEEKFRDPYEGIEGRTRTQARKLDELEKDTE